MIPEMASDYSAYLKVDIAKELGPAKESVEDMLTRLEEFLSLILMVQSEELISPDKTAQIILDKKNEFLDLCQRIDGMELLVGRVKRDLDSLEALLSAAEAENGSSDGVFMKILSPIFRKSESSSARSPSSPTFSPPEIFNPDKVFPDS